MTERLAFLLSMLIEGAVAALLGVWLRERLGLSRFSASVRACAAAVIGTGATHPVLWVGFSRLLGWTGIWWGAAVMSEAGVILAETLFYAAALRGHWRWSLALSAMSNLASFAAGVALTSWLPRPG
ncbi:MAG TPA: hypothetical protein VFE34_10200 [Dongiaceae bacterium]|jgi:hypothetical protein|nr:hypothetical protein [Dongiaceae bacterium]